MNANKIAEITQLNNNIREYELLLDKLVEKMRLTPIYSAEEDKYLLKIKQVETWIEQLNKRKEVLYG